MIRALPNANAAEAAARIAGVSTERDEGEGKFVQIRGTEPRSSNVTVNGVHIPGTQAGSRITKLDDVPTDILGAIEVSKTLTADQDADAIGGSVNLVTKTPEGAPRGYIAGQFGQSTLESRSQSPGQRDVGRTLRRTAQTRCSARRHLGSQQPRHQRHRARLGRERQGNTDSGRVGSARLPVRSHALGRERRARLSVR